MKALNNREYPEKKLWEEFKKLQEEIEKLNQNIFQTNEITQEINSRGESL